MTGPTLAMWVLTLIVVIWCIGRCGASSGAVLAADPRLAPDGDAGAVYLFWTGGYDSTFRLCELAVEQRRRVRPVYLTADDGAVDGIRGGRRNRQVEDAARRRILAEIRRRFPFARIDEPVVVDVTGVRVGADIRAATVYGMSAGAYTRPHNQYSMIAYITTQYGIAGEVCVTKNGPLNKFFDQFVVDGGGGVYAIPPHTITAHPVVRPYANMRFPTYGKSKDDMLLQAARRGYSDILHMTWSCWYPRKNTTAAGATYTPCGNCHMCTERRIAAAPLVV